MVKIPWNLFPNEWNSTISSHKKGLQNGNKNSPPSPCRSSSCCSAAWARRWGGRWRDFWPPRPAGWSARRPAWASAAAGAASRDSWTRGRGRRRLRRWGRGRGRRLRSRRRCCPRSRKTPWAAGADWGCCAPAAPLAPATSAVAAPVTASLAAPAAAPSASTTGSWGGTASALTRGTGGCCCCWGRASALAAAKAFGTGLKHHRSGFCLVPECSFQFIN